jgi:hypothetical protein
MLKHLPSVQLRIYATPRDALKRLDAAVIEAQTGTPYQVFDRTRHQDLASAGKRRNPRTCVNSDTAKVLTHQFSFLYVM